MFEVKLSASTWDPRNYMVLEEVFSKFWLTLNNASSFDSPIIVWSIGFITILLLSHGCPMICMNIMILLNPIIIHQS